MKSDGGFGAGRSTTQALGRAIPEAAKCVEILALRGVTKATAGIGAPRHDPFTLKTSGELKEDSKMTDHSFPYVLICSTFGTIVSLASVWIATAQSFAPVLGA